MALADTPSFAVREEDGAILLRRRTGEVMPLVRTVCIVVLVVSVPALATATIVGATLMCTFAGIVIGVTTFILGDQRATRRLVVRPKRELRAGPAAGGSAGYREDGGRALTVDDRTWKGGQIDRVLVIERSLKDGPRYIPALLCDDAIVHVDTLLDAARARTLAEALASALLPKNTTIPRVVAPDFAGGCRAVLVVVAALLVDLTAFVVLPLVALAPLRPEGAWSRAAIVGACLVVGLLGIDALSGLVIRLAMRGVGPDYLAKVRALAAASGEMGGN